MPDIANPVTAKSTQPFGHHSTMDELTKNEHFPKGFLSANVGTVNMHDESKNSRWEAMPVLPSAISLRDVLAAAPASPTEGDIYLLDNSGATYTVSAINHQSGNIVRYTFSGTPDLSGISVSNLLVCTGAVNTEHDGVFVISVVNDGSDFIDIINPAISDNSLDETTGATVETPHGDWNGAVNNSWVRFNETDSVFYAIQPVLGQCCLDISIAGYRCFNSIQWIGETKEIQLALSDESGSLTTGSAKVTMRIPFKFLFTDVRINVKTAPTGSTLTVDINDDGVSVFTTVISIDATEKTSVTATASHVFDETKQVIEDDSEITFDIDQVGSTIAGTGLKITLYGFIL